MNVKAHMPHNRRFYLLLVGNIVVLTILGLFAVRPALGLLVKRTNEISASKVEIAALEDRAVQLRKLKETLPTYETTYAPILASLPKEKDVAGYQAALESLAQTAGVVLSTVDTSGGKDIAKAAPTTYPSTTVTLDVKGTFATVYDFVSRLETMDRFTRVSELTLAADAEGAVKAHLVVQTFHLK